MTDNASEVEMIVRFEDARNRRYVEALSALQQRLDQTARRVVHARNAEWVQNTMPHAGKVPTGQLFGRVALDRDDELLDGRDFYIGVRHMERDGIQVFSWAAPVAATFFGQGRHDWCSAVICRRTLASDGARIIGVEDEPNGGPLLKSTVFPMSDSLTVSRPNAGTNTTLARFARRSSASSGVARVGEGTSPKSPLTSRSHQPQTAGLTRLPSPLAPTAEPPLRAERTLRSALEAPRRSTLGAILATMQADQYRSVTETADQSWVFAGGPGSGKTIIGLHRACFLVDVERGRKQLSRVLVVGPTTGYAHHVSGVVEQLGATESVTVASLSALLESIAGIPTPTTGSFAGPFEEVAWERLEECFEAASRIRSRGVEVTTRAVYEALRDTLGSSAEEVLRRLPTWEKARTWLRFLPLLAACGFAARAENSDWDHIVVDEAQDIRPLEWAILSRLRRAGATFTLLGDMNQRRHVTNYLSWNQLADDLRRHEVGHAMTLRMLRRGYRSTGPILEFAGRLLPKAERRTHQALRDTGPTVKVVHAQAEVQVARQAIGEGESLAATYPGGTVALIGVDPRLLIGELRKQQAVMVEPARHLWKLPNGTALSILRPTEARGMEFDGVVVMEPGDFPDDLLGFGTLYTSLTRANRELRIVHAKRLPEPLRKVR